MSFNLPEPLPVRERRHMAYINENRQTFASQSPGAFAGEGRGVWFIIEKCNGMSEAAYVSGPNARACSPGHEEFDGWPNARVQQMVREYNPASQFIVVIIEDKIVSSYKIAFFSVAGVG